MTCDPTLHGLAVEIARLKALMEADGRALILQAREYERRLDNLNHAHTQARDTLLTYMPREIADKNWQQMNEWKTKWEVEYQKVVTKEELDKVVTDIDKKIGLLTEYRQNIMGRFGALSDAWGWLIGFVGAAAAFITLYFK